MPRSRLAVALVVPEPVRTEIDGLRRALGGDVERIAPHITLVPPVNVRDEAIGEALEILRAGAAGQVGPLRLQIGPAATFAPANRVAYLAVGGEEASTDALDRLRRDLLHGPLQREDRREFVPHVTLTSHLPSGDDDLALSLLSGYVRTIEHPRVDLLRYDADGRRWSTVADVALGPRRIVGRGGLEVELTVSRRLDPEAAAALGAVAAPDDVRGEPIVVVARREGRVVGAVGTGWDPIGRVAELSGVTVLPEERGTGIGRHLLAALVDELVARGAVRIDAPAGIDDGSAALLAALGWSPRTVLHAPLGG